MFLRECEQIDSGTAGQEAFLANDDLGVCYVEYECATTTVFQVSEVVQSVYREHLPNIEHLYT